MNRAPTWAESRFLDRLMPTLQSRASAYLRSWQRGREMVIHIFKGEGRQPWYVRAVSRNGQTLTISEGYVSKWGAKRAARRMFPDTEILYTDK